MSPPPSSFSLSSSTTEVGEATDRLRLVVLRLARRIRTSSVDGITPSQLAVLGTVIRHERLTVGQIAELEHVQPPSVSKIVATLERRGLLGRETDANDRRCALIAPTASGVEYLDQVRAAGRTWLASTFNELDDDDAQSIKAALPALERLLGTGE